MKLHSHFSFAILCLTVFLGGKRVIGQNGGESVHELTQQNAANSWRFVGIDPAKQTDTVDPETRQARTAFWAQTLHDFAEVPGRNHGEISGHAYLLSEPEFYKASGELWVTGTFLSYKVFPIPSIHLAYTEVHFLVQSVISVNPPADLAPGKVITIGLPGGTLIEGGKPVSHFLSPRRYALKPGNSYLIQLFHNDTGDFYSGGRNWDITSGTV
ncbi:MAG: hypothetical protein ACRD28_13700, partial [Acidobacteriaceae bacterium]